ncbi:fumarylacetoacetate hydrolase family protein [Mesorhizobium sp. WSM4887]|uniref:fumarylacetoacetate hydrolase family protein n=1 Tax=Mesorhizobium sp. WSM4887 TaxID=3038543 RepID=UPI00241634A8|nr:fumarylacetoacetate hydrolase family protein [Mesorhizobium sp. WSM4887]MDG4889805.1 fumarylacetoacetate hydrolase family protein [Mesorhizobium sp. WSM4887]
MTTDFVMAPQPAVTLAVEGSPARFPTNRIFCIGRNYAAHAVEMGHDPNREPPFFFLKPVSALATDGIFPFPAGVGEVHHEVELVVALGSGGKDIALEAAMHCVFGYGIGLDMTLRDVQAEAKKLGRPWDVAKGFDGSAPCGAIVPATRIGHPTKGEVSLSIDGMERQRGNLDQMIWKVPEMIAALSRSFQLNAGDLIMTGTPAGVGPVKPGDHLWAQIEGVGNLTVRVE